jgi:hypothetical protein
MGLVIFETVGVLVRLVAADNRALVRLVLVAQHHGAELLQERLLRVRLQSLHREVHALHQLVLQVASRWRIAEQVAVVVWMRVARAEQRLGRVINAKVGRVIEGSRSKVEVAKICDAVSKAVAQTHTTKGAGAVMAHVCHSLLHERLVELLLLGLMLLLGLR